MNTKLLGGASVLVLTLGLSTGALAQNQANDNTGTQAVSQNSDDAAAGFNDAVLEGAIAGTGNALGQNVDNTAAASHSSTATQVDATDADAVATNFSGAADDGAVVFGNGVALGDDVNHQAIVGKDGVAIYSDEGVDDGSALHVGDNNSSATAEEDSAAANANSTAIWARFDIADEGSAVVVGNNNSTATADDGGASVAGAGTAIGITDVNIGGELFLPYEGGDVAVEGVDGGFIGFADDATLAFGKDNVVASAHLDSFVTGLLVAVNYGYDGRNENGDGDEKTTTVATGSIWGNSVSSAAGANRVVYNTGIANQGRALAVAGHSNFSNN